MNKQIIVFIALFAMVACVLAQYDQHYQKEEKKFIQIPALKLKLGTDKLMFRLPNLMSLFHTQQEHHYQPQYQQY